VWVYDGACALLTQCETAPLTLIQEEQVLRVCSSVRDQHISGVCVSPDGGRLFVGLEECLAEYRVDTTTRRTFADSSVL
jgi:hypothetical protein